MVSVLLKLWLKINEIRKENMNSRRNHVIGEENSFLSAMKNTDIRPARLKTISGVLEKKGTARLTMYTARLILTIC
jgi:hypothetical protein